MASRHPLSWLTEQAKTGVEELPENIRWLAGRRGGRRGVADRAHEIAEEARSRVERIKVSVADAAPLGPDSVEARMKRARDASERAREAERRALELAAEASDRATYAKEVAAEGRNQIEEQERAGESAQPER